MLRKCLFQHLFIVRCMDQINSTCVQRSEGEDLSEHQLILISGMVNKNVRLKPMREFLDACGIMYDKS